MIGNTYFAYAWPPGSSNVQVTQLDERSSKIAVDAANVWNVYMYLILVHEEFPDQKSKLTVLNLEKGVFKELKHLFYDWKVEVEINPIEALTLIDQKMIVDESNFHRFTKIFKELESKVPNFKNLDEERGKEFQLILEQLKQLEIQKERKNISPAVVLKPINQDVLYQYSDLLVHPISLQELEKRMHRWDALMGRYKRTKLEENKKKLVQEMCNLFPGVSQEFLTEEFIHEKFTFYGKEPFTKFHESLGEEDPVAKKIRILEEKVNGFLSMTGIVVLAGEQESNSSESINLIRKALLWNMLILENLDSLERRKIFKIKTTNYLQKAVLNETFSLFYAHESEDGQIKLARSESVIFFNKLIPEVNKRDFDLLRTDQRYLWGKRPISIEKSESMTAEEIIEYFEWSDKGKFPKPADHRYSGLLKYSLPVILNMVRTLQGEIEDERMHKKDAERVLEKICDYMGKEGVINNYIYEFQTKWRATANPFLFSRAGFWFFFKKPLEMKFLGDERLNFAINTWQEKGYFSPYILNPEGYKKFQIHAREYSPIYDAVNTLMEMPFIAAGPGFQEPFLAKKEVNIHSNLFRDFMKSEEFLENRQIRLEASKGINSTTEKINFLKSEVVRASKEKNYGQEYINAFESENKRDGKTKAWNELKKELKIDELLNSKNHIEREIALEFYRRAIYTHIRNKTLRLSGNKREIDFYCYALQESFKELMGDRIEDMPRFEARMKAAFDKGIFGVDPTRAMDLIKGYMKGVPKKSSSPKTHYAVYPSNALDKVGELMRPDRINLILTIYKKSGKEMDSPEKWDVNHSEAKVIPFGKLQKQMVSNHLEPQELFDYLTNAYKIKTEKDFAQAIAAWNREHPGKKIFSKHSLLKHYFEAKLPPYLNSFVIYPYEINRFFADFVDIQETIREIRFLNEFNPGVKILNEKDMLKNAEYLEVHGISAEAVSHKLRQIDHETSVKDFDTKLNDPSSSLEELVTTIRKNISKNRYSLDQIKAYIDGIRKDPVGNMLLNDLLLDLGIAHKKISDPVANEAYQWMLYTHFHEKKRTGAKYRIVAAMRRGLEALYPGKTFHSSLSAAADYELFGVDDPAQKKPLGYENGKPIDQNRAAQLIAEMKINQPSQEQLRNDAEQALIRDPRPNMKLKFSDLIPDHSESKDKTENKGKVSLDSYMPGIYENNGLYPSENEKSAKESPRFNNHVLSKTEAQLLIAQIQNNPDEFDKEPKPKEFTLGMEKKIEEIKNESKAKNYTEQDYINFLNEKKSELAKKSLYWLHYALDIDVLEKSNKPADQAKLWDFRRGEMYVHEKNKTLPQKERARYSVAFKHFVGELIGEKAYDSITQILWKKAFKSGVYGVNQTRLGTDNFNEKDKIDQAFAKTYKDSDIREFLESIENNFNKKRVWNLALKTMNKTWKLKTIESIDINDPKVRPFLELCVAVFNVEDSLKGVAFGRLKFTTRQKYPSVAVKNTENYIANLTDFNVGLDDLFKAKVFHNQKPDNREKTSLLATERRPSYSKPIDSSRRKKDKQNVAVNKATRKSESPDPHGEETIRNYVLKTEDLPNAGKKQKTPVIPTGSIGDVSDYIRTEIETAKAISFIAQEKRKNGAQEKNTEGTIGTSNQEQLIPYEPEHVKASDAQKSESSEEAAPQLSKKEKQLEMTEAIELLKKDIVQQAKTYKTSDLKKFNDDNLSDDRKKAVWKKFNEFLDIKTLKKSDNPEDREIAAKFERYGYGAHLKNLKFKENPIEDSKNPEVIKNCTALTELIKDLFKGRIKNEREFKRLIKAAYWVGIYGVESKNAVHPYYMNSEVKKKVIQIPEYTKVLFDEARESYEKTGSPEKMDQWTSFYEMWALGNPYDWMLMRMKLILFKNHDFFEKYKSETQGKDWYRRVAGLSTPLKIEYAVSAGQLDILKRFDVLKHFGGDPSSTLRKLQGLAAFSGQLETIRYLSEKYSHVAEKSDVTTFQAIMEGAAEGNQKPILEYAFERIKLMQKNQTLSSADQWDARFGAELALRASLENKNFENMKYILEESRKVKSLQSNLTILLDKAIDRVSNNGIWDVANEWTLWDRNHQLNYRYWWEAAAFLASQPETTSHSIYQTIVSALFNGQVDVAIAVLKDNKFKISLWDWVGLADFSKGKLPSKTKPWVKAMEKISGDVTKSKNTVIELTRNAEKYGEFSDKLRTKSFQRPEVALPELIKQSQIKEGLDIDAVDALLAEIKVGISQKRYSLEEIRSYIDEIRHDEVKNRVFNDFLRDLGIEGLDISDPKANEAYQFMLYTHYHEKKHTQAKKKIVAAMRRGLEVLFPGRDFNASLFAGARYELFGVDNPMYEMSPSEFLEKAQKWNKFMLSRENAIRDNRYDNKNISEKNLLKIFHQFNPDQKAILADYIERGFFFKAREPKWIEFAPFLEKFGIQISGNPWNMPSKDFASIEKDYEEYQFRIVKRKLKKTNGDVEYLRTIKQNLRQFNSQGDNTPIQTIKGFMDHCHILSKMNPIIFEKHYGVWGLYYLLDATVIDSEKLSP